MTELMSCASLQHAAVWCLAVQAADLALKHSRHVQELEDEINKLQEQLDETNKVCAFIFVILSLCIPHLSAHTHTHTRARTHTCTQHRGYQNTSSAQCADREKDRGRVGGWVAGVGFLGCVSTGVIRTHPTNCVLVQVWQPNNFFLFSKVSALVNAFTA